MSLVSSSSTLGPLAIAISEAAEDDEVLIPSLPNDVALNCLARVPRSKHPTLSLVSKPIRSLLSSPHFFNVRSSIPHSTEPIPYVIFYDKRSKDYRWFTLYRNPFNSIHSDLHVPIPVPPVPTSKILHNGAYAVLGTNIYVIGSSKLSRRDSKRVWILDCRINRWRRGPTMLAARTEPVANVLDGKIYVIGGTDESTIQAEVLDPEHGKWVELVCPFTINPRKWYMRTIRWMGTPSFVKDDELHIYVEGNQVAIFNPQGKGSWRFTDMHNSYSGSLFIDGIFYFCNYMGIHWFDVEEQMWKVLRYLDNMVLPMWGCKNFSYCALAYAAGNLILIGGNYSNEGENNNEISYIEIQVTKLDGELWGKVCCSQIIFPTPPATFYVHKCLAVDL